MRKILENISYENVHTLDNHFSTHFHDTFTVGITYEGLFKSHSLNQNVNFYKNSTRINNPAEVHGGSSQSWTHSNFYPSVELMSSIYEQIKGEKKVPYFSKHIIEDPILFFKLHHFFVPFLSKSEDLQIESNLIDALSYLILNYTTHTKTSTDIFEDKCIVKDTYEFINDSIETNFSLEQLAQNVNLSKYHFLRLFKKEFGLTPHHFIINQRVNKAFELIKNGVAISHASIEVGFNDQSHFARNLKKLYGYTPSKINK